MDVFLDEGREQLVLLEAGFLDMERGNQTAETMQALFRAAHTLKGSSRSMGFLSIGDLTHEMENILDDLRNNKLSVNTPIVDILLECLDALGSLVDAVAETQGDDGSIGKDIPALVARLNALRTNSPALLAVPQAGASEELMATGSVFALAPHEQAGLTAALDSELTAYHIAITLDTQCLMKSVRVWMVMSALEPLGSVLASDPPEEKLEEEEFDSRFSLLLATPAEAAEVEHVLRAVSELAGVSVLAWGAAEEKSLPEKSLPEKSPVVPEAVIVAKAAPTGEKASLGEKAPAEKKRPLRRQFG